MRENVYMTELMNVYLTELISACDLDRIPGKVNVLKGKHAGAVSDS